MKLKIFGILLGILAISEKLEALTVDIDTIEVSSP